MISSEQKSVSYQVKLGFYAKYIKRFLDIICSLSAIVVFCWLYAIIAVLVYFKMGSPVIFKQPRPGKVDKNTGKERVFNMYKFRTMTDARDESGNLRPDSERLSKLGRALRATSLDELPEAFNILKGDMSVVGPRPQLVRDMVFMSEEQRRRHLVRPGLSGLAQVSGRNAISWQDKLATDLVYIDKITFAGDVKIVWQTFKQVFVRKNMTSESEETDLAEDFGDALLGSGQITVLEYEEGQKLANDILAGVV